MSWVSEVPPPPTVLISALALAGLLEKEAYKFIIHSIMNRHRTGPVCWASKSSGLRGPTNVFVSYNGPH